MFDTVPVRSLTAGDTVVILDRLAVVDDVSFGEAGTAFVHLTEIVPVGQDRGPSRWTESGPVDSMTYTLANGAPPVVVAGKNRYHRVATHRVGLLVVAACSDRIRDRGTTWATARAMRLAPGRRNACFPRAS